MAERRCRRKREVETQSARVRARPRAHEDAFLVLRVDVDDFREDRDEADNAGVGERHYVAVDRKFDEGEEVHG